MLSLQLSTTPSSTAANAWSLMQNALDELVDTVPDEEADIDLSELFAQDQLQLNPDGDQAAIASSTLDIDKPISAFPRMETHEVMLIDSIAAHPRDVRTPSPSVFDGCKFHPMSTPHLTPSKLQETTETMNCFGANVVRSHSLMGGDICAVMDQREKHCQASNSRLRGKSSRKRSHPRCERDHEDEDERRRKLRHVAEMMGAPSASSSSSLSLSSNIGRADGAISPEERGNTSKNDVLLIKPAHLLEVNIDEELHAIADCEAPLISRTNPARIPLLKTAYWRLKDCKLLCRWDEKQQGLVVHEYCFNFATEFQYDDPWHRQNNPDDNSSYPSLHGKLLRTLAKGTAAKNAESEFSKFDRAAGRNTAHSGFLNLKTSIRATVAVFMKVTPLQPSKQIHLPDTQEEEEEEEEEARASSSPTVVKVPSGESSYKTSQGSDRPDEVEDAPGNLFLVRLETTTDRGYIKTFSMFMKKYSDKDQVQNKSRRKHSENRAKRSKGRKNKACSQPQRALSVASEENEEAVSVRAPANHEALLTSALFEGIMRKETGLEPQRAPASLTSDGCQPAQSTSSSSSEPLSTMPLSPGTLGMLKKFLPDEGWNTQTSAQQHSETASKIGSESSFESTTHSQGAIPSGTEATQDPAQFEIRPPVHPVFNMPMALGNNPS